MHTYVVEMPRRGRPLFEGGLAACARFIAAQAAPGGTRLVLVVSAPPPEQGVDAAVCVPASTFGDWELQAARTIADWEQKWLLIDSMPARHREQARADLHHAIASALVAAAINGVDAVGRPDELPF